MSRRPFAKSVAEGDAAEAQFVEWVKTKHGCSILKSKVMDDMRGHFDYVLTSAEGKQAAVDVKAMKRSARGDSEATDDIIWVELHGAHARNSGWLFGKATHIAFQTHDSWLIVPREALARYVLDSVNPGDPSVYVHTAAEATKGKIYVRRGFERLMKFSFGDIALFGVNAFF